MIELVLQIAGEPATKGSLKCVGRNGSHRLIESNAGTHDWRTAIAHATADASLPFVVEHARPMAVEIMTTIARPASHFTANGTLKASAPRYPTNNRTGDVDKYARLVLDALQDGGALDDDAQVVDTFTRKRYVDDPDPDALTYPGVIVRVYPADDGEES